MCSAASPATTVYDLVTIDGLVFPTLRAGCQTDAGRVPPVGAYGVHSRLHRPGGPQMIWKTKQGCNPDPDGRTGRWPFGLTAIRIEIAAPLPAAFAGRWMIGTRSLWPGSRRAGMSFDLTTWASGESSGETPNTVRKWRRSLPLLLDALGIGAVDLLGWSLGGYVGQTVALTWPERVLRLVIAGSGPRWPDGPPPHSRVAEIAAKTAATREDVQFLFFTETEAGTRPPDSTSIAFVSGSARPLQRNPVADSARRSRRG